MIKEKCSKCNIDSYIVNRTHKLCDDCNQIRLHGSNRNGTNKIKASKINDRRKTIIYKKPVFKKTEKQQIIDKKYSEVVKEILSERDPCCETCGKHNMPLSISHTISRKRCKEINRIDLITDKENLVVECFGAPSSYPTECHNLWEINNLKKIQEINPEMLRKKMQFIKQNDLQLYNILIEKL